MEERGASAHSLPGVTCLTMLQPHHSSLNRCI